MVSGQERCLARVEAWMPYALSGLYKEGLWNGAADVPSLALLVNELREEMLVRDSSLRS